VWSGKDQWEVERRYRDFFALYRQLYTLFTDHGLSLPSPWSRVERESRKIFGNASPDVISGRSILIQDCLQSILNSKFPFGTPSSLVCFLSPGQVIPNSSLLKSLVPQSLNKLGSSNSLSLSSLKAISTLGKTISLVVEIKPRKSMRQLLEIQHYTCAGCHTHLDAGKTLLREIVQTFGWNKPRFCEYTSQLFCASCHTNDTVVLPAKVLHHWDFSLYPVSQLAKAYLESIYDQVLLILPLPGFLHVYCFFLAKVRLSCFTSLLFYDSNHVGVPPYICGISYFFFPSCKLRCDQIFFSAHALCECSQSFSVFQSAGSTSCYGYPEENRSDASICPLSISKGCSKKPWTSWIST